MDTRHDAHGGRKSEIQGELDAIIRKLKLAIDRCHELSQPPPEDVSEALMHARHLRDLIDQEKLQPKRIEVVMYAIRLVGEVAKSINDLLNCSFTGVLKFGRRKNHQTASHCRMHTARSAC